jgi:hypothetical protein
MLMQFSQFPPEEYDIPMPHVFFGTHKFKLDQDEAFLPHTLHPNIRKAVIEGMQKVQPCNAVRLRHDVLPAFIAFRNGYIPPYVFNFIYRRLTRNKSDTDLKMWFKVCWVVLTANLESYQAKIIVRHH